MESSLGTYNMFMGRFLPYFAVLSTGYLILSANIAGNQRSLNSSTTLTTGV
jgi:hypothetical protein